MVILCCKNCLLHVYADHTDIISESAHDLQQALNEYEQYCETLRLVLYISMTKTFVFSKGRLAQYNFY